MLRTALIAVALSLAACGGEDEPKPAEPVGTAEFTIRGDEVSCPGAMQQWETIIGGATYRAQWCVWQCVVYDGAPADEVVIAFRLDDGAPAWEVAAVGTRDLPGECE